MNAGALRQITERWDEILAVLSWFAEQHAHLTPAARPSDPIAFFQRTSLVFAAPLCAFVADPTTEIHPAIAGAWKASLGFLAVAKDLVTTTLYEPAAAVSGDAIYDLAMRTGALIGHREVCAASPRMIVAAADAVLGHVPTPERRQCAAALTANLGVTTPALRAAAIDSDHWLYDKAVLLVAAMFDEDEPALGARRFPQTGEDRLLLVQPLAEAAFAGGNASWSALLELVADDRHADAATRRARLDAIQRAALVTLETQIRDELGLPRASEGVRNSLCFVDLRPASDRDRAQLEERLVGIASALRIEPRLDDKLRWLGRAVRTGVALQPATTTAELLAAYVRFAREVARIEGLPVQIASVEALASDVATTLRRLCDATCFEPSSATFAALADELASAKHDETSRALPGDPAAWVEALEPWVHRRDLRILAQVDDRRHLVRWLSSHVATHPTARIDDTLADTAGSYALAVVAASSSRDDASTLASQCWMRLDPDGMLVIVASRGNSDGGCPFRPDGASIKLLGGAWFVSMQPSAVDSPTSAFVVRGSHGDNPFTALRVRVE
jgi:hypothetical protein